MNLETLRRAGLSVLEIVRNGSAIACGVFLPDAVMCFNGEKTSAVSYPDTGIFILLKGSHVFAAETKTAQYIDEEQKTTGEIIFQSRNAAAQFVLGKQGSTNDWRPQS